VQYKHIDLADGESHALGQPRDRQGNKVPSRGLEDYLDDATSFIAAHLRRGCVLVHCVAGKSRSVAVAVAYFCRYAGMNLYEAKNLVFGCVPGAKLYPCFEEAIKRWLKLDELERQGPRQVMLRRLTQQGEEMGMYKQEDLP
jgi:protein-tyrosine phosphatase